MSPLVAQVAAAIGGDASPFVTAASLKLTMEGFITQVNARIDSLAPISSKKPSKRKKLQDHEDSIMGDPAMDNDETDTLAAAANKVAGCQQLILHGYSMLRPNIPPGLTIRIPIPRMHLIPNPI
jgi:hypothetical protein